MPLIKTRAIILKVYDYSETSQIASVFTEDAGRVQILAKGAKRLKGPFHGPLEPVTLNRLAFIVKKTTTLYTLTERVLLDAYRPLRRDLGKLYPACAAVEIVLAITPEAVENKKLFSFFVEVLSVFSSAAGEKIVLLAFLLKVLSAEGFALETGRCMSCGRGRLGRGTVLLSAESGGVLCPACEKNADSGIRISSGARRIIVQLGRLPLREIPGIGVPRNFYLEIKRSLNYYIKSVLERSLRVLDEYKGWE
jgi:DNA repair protein RecO (recombination protein O)